MSTTRRSLLSRVALAATSFVLPSGNTFAQAAGSTPSEGVVISGSSSNSPEARLIEVYRAIAAGDSRALLLAEDLVREVPNFQLGQLVYGDLLLSRTGSSPAYATVMDGPPVVREQLQKLRMEASRRLNVLREGPPPGAWPEQVLELAHNVRHVVVVDASRSRVYVFEHRATGLNLIRNFYASIGRAGFDKQIEGDLRTPLGVYHITSRLRDKQLDELYGVGALPLNYPNEHDRRLGRTGSGIWLHGVPRAAYSRSPFATEGCVALANDDMAYLMNELEPRRTPVIITDEVKWVQPDTTAFARTEFRALLSDWMTAWSEGDRFALQSFYSTDFLSGKGRHAASRHALRLLKAQPLARRIDIKNVSIFRWKRESEVTVVNFTEIVAGRASGLAKRQYWGLEQGRWVMFFDGAVG